MDAEGLNIRRVSWSGSYNDSAAWSPNGDRLAHASRVDGWRREPALDPHRLGRLVRADDRPTVAPGATRGDFVQEDRRQADLAPALIANREDAPPAGFELVRDHACGDGACRAGLRRGESRHR